MIQFIRMINGELVVIQFIRVINEVEDRAVSLQDVVVKVFDDEQDQLQEESSANNFS